MSNELFNRVVPADLPAVPFGLPEPNAWFSSEEKAHAGAHTNQLKRRKDRLEDFEEIWMRLLNPIFRATSKMHFDPLGKTPNLFIWQQEGVSLLHRINNEGLTFDQDGRGPQIPRILGYVDPYQGQLNAWKSKVDRVLNNIDELRSLIDSPEYGQALSMVQLENMMMALMQIQGVSNRDLQEAFVDTPDFDEDEEVG